MNSYLLIGGARSGKSQWAIEFGNKFTTPCYIATSQILDDEMAQRVEKHQKERGENWITIESGLELHKVIEYAISNHDYVVVDCLTVWTGQWMEKHEDEYLLDHYIQSIINLISKNNSNLVFITNEVGMGIVPDNALARRYRDLLGNINQKIAASCDHVILFAAGIPLAIKGEIPK